MRHLYTECEQGKQEEHQIKLYLRNLTLIKFKEMNDEDDLLFGVKPEEPSISPRITTEPTTHSNSVDCDFNLILG